MRTVSGTLLVYHLKMGCAHVHMSTHPEDGVWDSYLLLVFMVAHISTTTWYKGPRSGMRPPETIWRPSGPSETLWRPLEVVGEA